MIRHLWLAWLPLVFLPNVTNQIETGFGTLESSDFLIAPYIILVFHAARRAQGPARIHVHALLPLLCAFVGWAALSTISIVLRYDPSATRPVLFGLLKLAKLSLYGWAGMLTAVALRDARSQAPFHYALLLTGCVVAGSLITLGSAQATGIGPADVSSRAELLALEAVTAASKRLNYKATNAISALMAVLICYLVGLWAEGYGSRLWRRTALAGLALMTAGFCFSDGRGGWVAAALGMGYMFLRRGFSGRTLMATAAIFTVSIYCYFSYPGFRRQVDITLFPDEAYREVMAEYGAGVAGIDDGARLSTWIHEGMKFAAAPLCGTGFFHRGGLSGLWSTGSHNFFLQMFLETGLIGGSLVIAMFVRMWRQAGSPSARGAGLTLPLRASLVAALAGGMSGEYFYGGVVLLTLFLVYAPVGALPVLPPARSGGAHGLPEDRALAADRVHAEVAFGGVLRAFRKPGIQDRADATDGSTTES